MNIPDTILCLALISGAYWLGVATQKNQAQESEK